MLVGSLKKIENIAGSEMYMYQADKTDGLQKSMRVGLISPSRDSIEDSVRMGFDFAIS
jgi:hypothetical protein